MQLGLELAMMGMGTVFTFLILLIFLTSWMSKIIIRFEQSAALKVQQNSELEYENTTNTMDDALLKKILSHAIQQHRSRKGTHH